MYAGQPWDKRQSQGHTRVSAVRETVSAGETFAEFYEELMPKIYRYVYYKVNSTQVAEDLTSTVFEKALVNFGKFSRDRASFSTWIFSIARNTVIDHYRVQGRRQTVPLNEAIQVSSGDLPPDEELVRKEELGKLRAAVSQLSSDEQEIISLKFGSEFNNRQIAEMLGLSESNVGTKLYRAVRKLRDSFRELENG